MEEIEIIKNDMTSFGENDTPKDRVSRKDIFISLNRNEDGDAELFRMIHEGQLIYDHSAGHWYCWNGQHWEEDLIDQAVRNVEKIVDLYSEEADRQAEERINAERSGNKDKASLCRQAENDLLRRIRSLQGRLRKMNVIFLSVCGDRSLGITGQEWDKHPMLLGVANGVLELTTGGLRNGKREDYIKTFAPTEWRGIDEAAPVWEKTLNQIFDNEDGNNEDIVGFVQRLFGYCLTGSVVEHIIPIFYGKGRNGKGTLFETFFYVLGKNLVGQVESELLLQQKFMRPSGSPTSDIMNLQGKRFVWASETEEGRKINAGKLKWLSGGDTLTGRHPHGRRQVSFYPTHKLILLTNHLPHADSNDYALWHRIFLVPFKISFIDDPMEDFEKKADPDILNKLKNEGPGILAWLVRGCLEWQRQGLNPPGKVKAATLDYKEEEDLVKKFITEKCTLCVGSTVRAGELYRVYNGWCLANALKPLSGTSFGKMAKERFDSYRDGKGVYYLGVTIQEPPQEPEDT